jgi:hypothetical protein
VVTVTLHMTGGSIHVVTVTFQLPYCFIFAVVVTLHQPNGSKVLFAIFHLTGGSRLLVIATFHLPYDSMPVIVVTFHLQVLPEPCFPSFT